MDEYKTLAVVAVEALQAANATKWPEIGAVVIGFLQCGLIAWGILEMNKSNRSREASTALMIQQGKALERLLERTL